MQITVTWMTAAEAAEMGPAEVRRRLPSRWARANRYRKEEDRLLCLAAGHLLLNAVGVRWEEELKTDSSGRPFAVRGPSFSISHSGELCAIATGSGRLGLDLERMEERNLICAPSVLTSAEAEWMADDALVRFHMLWTRKEALAKAAGTGLYREPKQIEVLPLEKGAGLPASGKRFFLETYPFERYCMSLCAEDRIDGIVMKNQPKELAG